MKNKNLQRKVLAGLVSLSFAAGSPFLFPATSTEAAEASLYDQYMANQKDRNSQGRNVASDSDVDRAAKERELEDLKRQVAEAQRNLHKDNKASASKDADDTDASAPTEVGPNDFLSRVRAILYGNGKTSTPPTSDITSSLTEASAPSSAPMEQTAPSTPAPVMAQPPVQQRTSDALFDDTRKFNYDWRGTPLAQTIYTVAKIAGKGIVINGDLKGSVYGSLQQATCGQALDYLSRAYDFNWMTDGNNIIVSTDDKMSQSAVLNVSYLNKAKVVEEMKALGISEGNVYANSETGTVSIMGTPYQIQQARQRLQVLDHPVAQCLIVGQLIEIDHGKNLNLGLSYTLPTYSHSAETSNGTTENSSSTLKGWFAPKLAFSASSEASRALSKGKVIARPMVMALNGEEGSVNFGDQVPIQTTTATTSSTSVSIEYKDIGTSLKVTPVINERTDEVSLKVEAEISNITQWLTAGGNRAPQIATRKATTSAHLRSGQSLVIGGLMSSTDLDNLSGIPGLMNLPILGELFKYHSHTRSYAEVYIMLTPYIVTDGGIDTQQLLREAESIKKYTGGTYYGYGHDNGNANGSNGR